MHFSEGTRSAPSEHLSHHCVWINSAYTPKHWIIRCVHTGGCRDRRLSCYLLCLTGRVSSKGSLIFLSLIKPLFNRQTQSTQYTPGQTGRRVRGSSLQGSNCLMAEQGRIQQSSKRTQQNSLNPSFSCSPRSGKTPPQN